MSGNCTLYYTWIFKCTRCHCPVSHYIRYERVASDVLTLYNGAVSASLCWQRLELAGVSLHRILHWTSVLESVLCTVLKCICKLNIVLDMCLKMNIVLRVVPEMKLNNCTVSNIIFYLTCGRYCSRGWPLWVITHAVHGLHGKQNNVWTCYFLETVVYKQY